MTKKFISIILALLLVSAALPLSVYAAEAPAASSSDSGNIYFSESGEDYYNEYPVYEKGSVNNTSVQGVSYNAAKRVLTLDHVNRPELSMNYGNLGGELTVIVVGDCELSSIYGYSYSYNYDYDDDFYGEASLNLDGDGTLTLNRDLDSGSAINISSATNYSVLTFSDTVKANLYSRNNAVAIYNTIYQDPDDAIIFHGYHSADAEIEEWRDSYDEHLYAHGYSDDDFYDANYYLGEKVINADDPEGFYCAVNWSSYDPETDFRQDGYMVHKLFYSDTYGMLFYDPQFGEDDEGVFGVTITQDDWDDGPFSFAEDERGDTIEVTTDTLFYSKRADVYIDGKGNRYAVYDEYDPISSSAFTTVAEIKSIPEREGVYLFAQTDIDPDTLTPTFGSIVGFSLTSYSYSNLGFLIDDPGDPDGIYTAKQVTYSRASSGSDEPIIEEMMRVNRYLYLDQYEGYIPDPAFGNYGEKVFSIEEYNKRGYRYQLDENGNKKQLLTNHYIYQYFAPSYQDDKGNIYALFSDSYYDDITDDSVICYCEPITGLSDVYWMTRANNVDTSKLKKRIVSEEYVIHNAVVKSELLEYRGGEGEDLPMIGDVDNDKTVSVLDATRIQKHMAEIIVLTKRQLQAADVDRDGYVSVLDATRIQKYKAMLMNLDGSKPYTG